MLKYEYALLVDNFQNNETTTNLLQNILNNQYDVTIFALNKENIVVNPLAIFDIVEYFSWVGPTIITSFNTLEKTISYPVIGPKIIIGTVNYKDYITTPIFDLNKINAITNEFYKNVS